MNFRKWFMFMILAFPFAIQLVFIFILVGAAYGDWTITLRFNDFGEGVIEVVMFTFITILWPVAFIEIAREVD